MPLTTPVVAEPEEPTVPTVITLLLHIPPVVVSLKVVVKPSQTLAVPVIAAGRGLMVTGVVV